MDTLCPRGIFGWGGGIRTPECRNQNPVPYHLATPHRYNSAALVIDLLRKSQTQFAGSASPPKSAPLALRFCSGVKTFKSCKILKSPTGKSSNYSPSTVYPVTIPSETLALIRPGRQSIVAGKGWPSRSTTRKRTFRSLARAAASVSFIPM